MARLTALRVCDRVSNMAYLDNNAKMLLQKGWRMLCLGMSGFPVMSESRELGACSQCVPFTLPSSSTESLSRESLIMNSTDTVTTK